MLSLVSPVNGNKRKQNKTKTTHTQVECANNITKIFVIYQKLLEMMFRQLFDLIDKSKELWFIERCYSGSQIKFNV